MSDGRAQLGHELYAMRVVERDRGPAPARGRGDGVARSGFEPCLLAVLRLSAYTDAGRGSSSGLPEALARTGRLARAVELTYSTGGGPGQGDGLVRLVRAAGEAGHLDGALALAGSLPERQLRDRALVALVPAVARAGGHDRAVDLVGRLRYPHTWARAWAALAKAAADGGDLRAALGFAARADECCGFGPDAGQVLVLVMEIAAAVGDHARAGTLADRVEDFARSGGRGGFGADRPRPLAAVLAFEARGGDLDRMDALLRGLSRSAPDAAAGAAEADEDEDEDEDDGVLYQVLAPPRSPLDASVMAEVLDAVAGTADRDAALALAGRAETLLRTDGRFDGEILRRAVVRLLARWGRVEQAMALADRIDEPDLRAGWQAEIVGVFARHGDTDRAAALAAALDDRWARVRALVEVVRELARRGDPDRAEALARTIADEWARGEALVEVVRELARRGDPDRAEALARTVVHRSTRSRALAALVESSEPSRARRLAAQAILLGGWAVVLPSLERIAPQAVAVAADELTG